MINQFKDQYCLSGSSQALLGSIISGCGLSQDPEELFFELKETLFGGVANMPQCAKDVIVADRLNFLNSGGPDDITVGELMSIFGEENIFSCDMVPGIEETEIPPLNPPITVTRLVCPLVFGFKTIADPATNTSYAATIETDVYVRFTIPGSTQPVGFRVANMMMRVMANNNSGCLPSCSQFAANALNIAVAAVQNSVNNEPPGTPRIDIVARAKRSMVTNLDRALKIKVKNCSAGYGATVEFKGGVFNNWENLPVNNCDALIGNCPP